MRAYNRCKNADMQKLDAPTHRGDWSNVNGTTRAGIVPLTSNRNPRCVCCLVFAGPRLLLSHGEVNSFQNIPGLVPNLDVPCPLGIGRDRLAAPRPPRRSADRQRHVAHLVAAVEPDMVQCLAAP